MCLHVESVFMLCLCVQGWYEYSTCHFVRCRRHSVTVFSVHKNKVQTMLFCASCPNLFHALCVFVSFFFLLICRLFVFNEHYKTGCGLKKCFKLSGERIKCQTAECEDGSFLERWGREEGRLKKHWGMVGAMAAIMKSRSNKRKINRKFRLFFVNYIYRAHFCVYMAL